MLPRRIPLTVSIASLVLGTSACSPPADVPSDAGLLLPDVFALDTGPVDVGPTDTGDWFCGDTTGSTAIWAPVPDACLPRCSAATRAAIEACPDEACRAAARAADTTPPVLVQTRNGLFTVGCARGPADVECQTWQLYSCQGDWCPTEFNAWADCINAHAGSCSVQLATLNACTAASSDYAQCEAERFDACLAR